MDRLVYEDRILQLLNGADMLMSWVNDYYAWYNAAQEQLKTGIEKNHFINAPIAKHVLLHINLYYFEVVSILFTLLHDGDKDELSFKNYFKENKNRNFEAEISPIKNSYRSSGLYRVRNQIGDHKDSKSVGDPANLFMMKLNPELIAEADKLTKGVRAVALKYFSDPVTNNDIGGYFDNGHRSIMCLIGLAYGRG